MSHGNSCDRSISAARGATRSRARVRTRSRTSRCSSVRTSQAIAAVYRTRRTMGIRICSLLPSATEIVAELGFADSPRRRLGGVRLAAGGAGAARRDALACRLDGSLGSCDRRRRSGCASHRRLAVRARRAPDRGARAGHRGHAGPVHRLRRVERRRRAARLARGRGHLARPAHDRRDRSQRARARRASRGRRARTGDRGRDAAAPGCGADGRSRGSRAGRSSCASGRIRRSPQGTGFPRWSTRPAATTCWDVRAGRPTPRHGAPSSSEAPSSSCSACCGFDAERAAREANLPDLPMRVVAVDANAYYSRPSPRIVRRRRAARAPHASRGSPGPRTALGRARRYAGTLTGSGRGGGSTSGVSPRSRA